LENDKPLIYFKGKQFRKCKYLLFNILIHQIKKWSEINSINKADEKLKNSGELLTENSIHPLIKFWIYCCHLQTWAQNQYDTRILHTSIAFPLLKALVDAGDKKALRIFKEEISSRLINGGPGVIKYLIDEHYHYYLTDVEVCALFEDPEFIAKFDKAYYLD